MSNQIFDQTRNESLGYKVIIIRSLLAVLLASLTWKIHDNFAQYVLRQQAAYQASVDAANLDLANFTNSVDEIQVELVNTTGGIERVYLGTNGAMTSLSNGVDKSTPPELVDTLPSHSNDTINVHEWENKYISLVTSYVFLTPVSSPAYQLQANFFREDQSNFVTTIFAIPNQSDRNFTGYPTTFNALPGMTVAYRIQKKIDGYKQAHQPDLKDFPTDFWSYVQTVLTHGWITNDGAG